jgi:hypothetical protein
MCAPLTSQHVRAVQESGDSVEGRPKSTHSLSKQTGVLGHRWALVFTARTSTAWSPPLQHQDPGSHTSETSRATLSILRLDNKTSATGVAVHTLVEVWVNCDKSQLVTPEGVYPMVRSPPATRKRYAVGNCICPTGRGPGLTGLQWFTTSPVGRLRSDCNPTR